VTIRNLGFEGNSNVRFAIYHWANITGDELLRVQDCRFKSFTRSNARAVYVYPAHAIWIDGCEFQDCIRAIFMEDPDGDVFITNNKIWSPTTGVNPAYGIICQAPTAPLNGPILIAGNTVEDVKADPSTFGADGHGIQLYNVRGARVEGNVVRNCITSGIHVGDGCFGTEVVGNWVADCRSGDGTAIYVELAILSADTSVGTGAQRGATISGNTCTNNNHGIVASYSAATTISDNVVYNNEGNGIFSDSDRLSITNNIVYNNWKTLTPSGDLAKKAGIRNYGSRTAHIGNSCFDNQSTKTQEYGIAINNGTGDQDGKHVVVGNQLQGNGVNGIWEDTGSTNIVANNMT